MSIKLLDAALTYANRGWSIIPTTGKRAAVTWKHFQERPADDVTLRQMFGGQGITGMAVILGHVSGDLACRDFDLQASYDHWATSHPALASSLPTVATARGRHVYFRGPDGFSKLDDGEYRGTVGQYVLLPPSRHPAGTSYRWLVPLPDGELPVIDPAREGLCNTASAADTANTANTWHMLEAPAVLQAIEDAINATQPSTEGQRNNRIFLLARHVKAIEMLRDADFSTLRPIVQEWHRRAFQVIGTKPFLETWCDFVRAWKRAKVPAGDKPVQRAFELAKQAVESDPPLAVLDLYGSGPIVMLATLCRELQRIAGAMDFFLDCRTAGHLIGVDHSTAWRYLDVLCADGVLVAGCKGSRATRKASKYRYIDINLTTARKPGKLRVKSR